MRFLNSNALHVAAMAALAIVVSAALAEASEVKVGDAWLRALPSGLPAGGYFTLHNNGAKTAEANRRAVQIRRHADAAPIKRHGRHDAYGRCREGRRSASRHPEIRTRRLSPDVHGACRR